VGTMQTSQTSQAIRCGDTPRGLRLERPWHQAIAPVDRLGEVADRITSAVRTVDG
jgi:hypothetical protein